MPGRTLEVAVICVAEEDRWECKNGDTKREDCIEEEVDSWGYRGEGIRKEGVEGSAEPVEAYWEGEGQGAVVCREAADAENKADCVEPADAAPCYQADQEHLQGPTYESEFDQIIKFLI